MKTKLWMFIGILLTVLNIAVLGTLTWHFTLGPAPRDFPGREGPMKMIPGLNDQDRELVRSTLESFRDTLMERDLKLREIERRSFELMAGEVPSKDSLLLLIDHYYSIRKSISVDGAGLLTGLKQKLPGREIEHLTGLLLFRPGGPEKRDFRNRGPGPVPPPDEERPGPGDPRENREHP
ncbi:MAG: hypothetical protein L6Q77_09970 [Bacteroidetes bacterium]|nr:hypothetical protein [Bacteroidota bacterium]